MTSSQIFNNFVKYEQTPKNRVKNAIACDKELVPLDEKKKLHKYSRLHMASGYRLDYQFPESKDFGRIKEVPYTGLGTFSAPVRGYLANGIYLDVDMVNCHPTILKHEFDLRGIDSGIITEYLSRREDFLISENFEKQDFLRMFNKEDFKHPSPKLTKLHTQIYKVFLPSVLEDNQDIIKSIKMSRSYNKMGVFMGNYLQKLEFNILQALHNYSAKESVFIDVLMHDGFFVRITEQVNEKFITDIMIPKYISLIKREFGMDIKMKIKAHDLSLKIPDIADMTPLEIHTEALLEYTKAEKLRKLGNMVYKRKNGHPMYYEDYYEEYNSVNKESPKTLKDFFHEVFAEDKLYNSCVKYANQLFEYTTTKRDFGDFPDLVRNKNFIAFKNGTLQLYPFKFYTMDDLEPIEKFIARHYIDEDFTGCLATPNLDNLIMSQITEESYHILRVLIGRLFFNLNIHDSWQVAPYLRGDPHAGKSTLMTLLDQCLGSENIGTLSKSDKVFQLSGIYNKDVVIVPDIRDCKEYIDEDILQCVISGERTTIRCMRTTPFSHVWNKPIIFGSNYNPDWNDTEGALRRRLIFFAFTNSIEEKDTDLPKRLNLKRGCVIARCIMDYLDFCDKNKREADFNKFLTEELQGLKDDFKEFSDPLSEFLSLGKRKVGDYHYSIVYKPRARASVNDFKARFEGWLRGTKHDQSYRLNTKHLELRKCGFEYQKVMVCKSCGKDALKGCCDNYDRLNRTCEAYYANMLMVKEAVNQSHGFCDD